VKIFIKNPGKKNASIKNTLDMATESCIAIPIIFSIVFVSFLPQYCAASIMTPDAMPAYTRFKINII